MRIRIEAERRRRQITGDLLTPPADWRDRLKTLFPKHFSAPFAPRHEELWEWVTSIRKGERPRPFTGFWGRGGAKSTNAEAAVIDLGARDVRRYCWYVSATQDKADSHVENIAGMLETAQVSKYYPDLGSRMMGKFGNSKGWRRNRLRTASGLTVDSLGLDTGARGVKIEDARPDLIIFDDVDELHDTTATTNKKKQTITQSVLPSGSTDCAVMFIQNLIHPNSLATMLADGRADWLIDRIISGPYPAVDGLIYEQIDGRFVITGGVATWEGQSLQVCQQQIDTWGLTAFLQESQHDVDRAGGMWNHIEFQHIEYTEKPDFMRTAVWVDPAVTTTDDSDSMGISAGGIDAKDKIYGLFWWEGITTPEDAISRAIKKAIEVKSLTVGVETDQGGDTWQSVYSRSLSKVKEELKASMKPEEYAAVQWPTFIEDKAGAGYGSKAERNQKMMADYEHGQVVHVIGTHTVIEKSLKRFPNKPLDLADSWFWTWNDLRNGAGGFAEFARRRLEAMKRKDS